MPSSSKVVIAINGFLGRTSDWDLIPDLMPSGWTLHAVTLWKPGSITEYEAWARQFTGDVTTRFEGASRKVLLAYSMGGRLGLHALVHAPTLFDSAMIVSANPGLMSADDRELRRKTDEVWATKFAQENWANLMTEWNQQTVFRSPLISTSIPLIRNEADFDRTLLSQTLRTWSLGAQRDLRSEISELRLPIEFVSGKADLKFAALAQRLADQSSKGPRSHVSIGGAGHRVPWDAPAQFRATLANFLSRW